MENIPFQSYNAFVPVMKAEVWTMQSPVTYMSYLTNINATPTITKTL